MSVSVKTKAVKASAKKVVIRVKDPPHSKPACYMPILKLKAGELAAVNALSPNVRNRIFPIFELVPQTNSNVEKGKIQQSPQTYLTKIADKLAGIWPSSANLAIDMHWYIKGQSDQTNVAAIHMLHAAMNKHNLPFCPVARPDMSTAVCKAIASMVIPARGLILRINDGFLPSNFSSLLAHLSNPKPATTDILFDIGPILTSSISTIASGVQAKMAGFGGLNGYRSIWLGSGAFPQSLASSSPQQIPRSDWVMWNMVHTTKGISLVPRFADYGISHPDLSSFDPKKMTVAAQLRYTSILPNTHWLVHKGRAVKNGGAQDMHPICDKVRKQASDFGPVGFCAADVSIVNIAQKIAGPGNAATWRTIGTNRHISQVVHSLQALGY